MAGHGWSHVGLSTLDLDKTRAFYEGVLGFPAVRSDIIEFAEGGLSAGEIAKNFDAVFSEHLNVPGIPVTKAMADARAAAAKK